MNLLDLPLHIILIGWLFRRITKPETVTTITNEWTEFRKPFEVYHALSNSILSIYDDRPPVPSSTRWWHLRDWLMDVLIKYDKKEWEACCKLVSMNVVAMGTIKKGE